MLPSMCNVLTFSMLPWEPWVYRSCNCFGRLTIAPVPIPLKDEGLDLEESWPFPILFGTLPSRELFESCCLGKLFAVLLPDDKKLCRVRAMAWSCRWRSSILCLLKTITQVTTRWGSNTASKYMIRTFRFIIGIIWNRILIILFNPTSLELCDSCRGIRISRLEFIYNTWH